MGRRDADAQPPIEILGADLGVGSTQQVALGPRRPKPSRGRSLGIAVGVVVLLVGGLVLGGGDDEEGSASPEERDNQERIDLPKPQTSTTARRTTTTRPTTTTTLPLGPILGEPVEGELVVFSGVGWTRVDLTTGEVTEIELPPANDYESVALAGGIAMPSGSGEIWFYPVLGAGGAPEPVVLGPGDQVARAGPARVWLFDNPPQDEAVPDPHVGVRLVDLTGQVLRSFVVPGRYASEATSDAVLLSRGGRVYAADESGLRPIGTGWLMGAIGDAALVAACDDLGVCALQRQPTDGRAARVVVEPIDPDNTYFDSVVAPDGRVALLEYDQFGGALRMLLLGAAGERLGEYEPVRQDGHLPVFLPGDLGFLVVGQGGLERLHQVDGVWRSDELPNVQRGQIEGVFVVTP